MRRLVVALSAVAMLGAACAQGGGVGAGGGGGAQVEPGGPVVEAPGLQQGGSLGAVDLPRLAPNVITEAHLRVEVDEGGVRSAVDRATAIADQAGGFVLSSDVGGDEARRGRVVLRVPADRFEEAVAALRDVGSLRDESITGEEVGQEFVDLQGRLRNARAQEVVLLRLMDDASSIADTIRVQRELEGVQLEIEQLRGRLRFLHDRTALATITVDVGEAGAVAESGVFATAWTRSVGVFKAVIAAIIVMAGGVIPLGVLAGVVVLVVLWVRRVRRVRPAA
jgi:hypothetical protein